MNSPALDIDRTLAALADPHRRRTIDLLREGPHRAGDLAEALALTPPVMSRHLRVLRQSGLVQEESPEFDARVRIYSLRPGATQALRLWLDEVEAMWTQQLGAFREHLEENHDYRDEHDLVALSQAWMQAIVTNQAAEIEPYMADDWVLVTPEAGAVDRRRFLGAIESGDLIHEAMAAVGETRVRLYGDTATLVSRVQNRGAYAGQPFVYDEWSTDLYVRMDRRWRCVLTALTPVATGQARD